MLYFLFDIQIGIFKDFFSVEFIFPKTYDFNYILKNLSKGEFNNIIFEAKYNDFFKSLETPRICSISHIFDVLYF